MLRNFISVTGITQEKELKEKVKGQLLQHSDIDYIFIPSNRPRAKELTHISISVDIKNHKVIKTPIGTVVILDGLKKLKLCYIPEGRSKRTIQVELYLPYNTHLELPDEVKDLDKVDIYIGDAYFELIEGRKIYSFIFYILDLKCKSEQSVRCDFEEEFEESSFQESTEEIPESEPKENMPPPVNTTEDLLSQLQKVLLPFTSNEADFNFEDDFIDDFDEGNIDVDDENSDGETSVNEDNEDKSKGET